ncbi:hypothetical protein [Streptomyces malaysiense]|uniref:Uncharacterized protein n=1 Tax=Streptomyces malaysiense TaxID=1428626 RepID=A0A1J4PVT3_9ACTN|nr:hypothetical protein [Streptomyces malaysiense]OIK24206.1 hypothetical protein VT52_028395 [Streptomyces malaysiense]
MIVWLNGPFGGGKTSLAAGLCRALSYATAADPETVGDLLRSTLTGHPLRPRDYQDLPLWRELTAAFVVHTDPVVLQERIAASWEFPGDAERSEAVRACRRRRAADYEQAATGWMHASGHVIDTSTLTVEQTLHAALDHLRLPVPARPRPPEAPQA